MWPRTIRKSVLLTVFNYCKYRSLGPTLVDFKLHLQRRSLHSSSACYGQDKDPSKSKEVVVYEDFDSIKDKSEETFMKMVMIFESGGGVRRRGHVEFIYTALQHMEAFKVNRKLAAYKKLVDVLPKGKFIPTNIFQAEFMHYPKQQQCIIDLLEQMEDNGVIPDYEMEDILMNIFGSKGFPLRKFWRMMYWMPKFKNLSPWLLPEELPNEILELAKLAVQRICSVDMQSKLTVYQINQTLDIPSAVDETWIVSSQSQLQRGLLAKHNPTSPVYVEGGTRVWLRNKAITYFILRAEPKPVPQFNYDPDDVSNISVPLLGFPPPARGDLIEIPSVHEQEDGVILAVCVTGTSSKDSLLSWIRHLEKDGNPALGVVPVVFTLRSAEKELEVVPPDPGEKSVEGT